jgi:DNA-directed RNA polymerase subunit RPC12/RpoP
MANKNPKRNYHEKKAKRCIKNAEAMFKEIEQLHNEVEQFTSEKFRKVKKISEEYLMIMSSTVTLRCVECGNQFIVPFTSFAKKDYEDHCPDCRTSTLLKESD